MLVTMWHAGAVTTTTRTFRCPDDPWQPAMAKANREGRTLSEVLVEFLRGYADRPDRDAILNEPAEAGR